MEKYSQEWIADRAEKTRLRSITPDCLTLTMPRFRSQIRRQQLTEGFNGEYIISHKLYKFAVYKQYDENCKPTREWRVDHISESGNQDWVNTYSSFKEALENIDSIACQMATDKVPQAPEWVPQQYR